MPAQAVGRFEVLRKLGAGGMGVVYLARDPTLERQVAIKVLGAEPSLENQARLLREARAMAQLSHPNVIHVYEVGVVEERVFVAMEFVDGVTLREWSEGQRRPWEDILNVFGQAGRGLAAAHAVGLVHRDFKPENVLVGSDGRVRVLDFGLARSLSVGKEPSGEIEPADRSEAPISPVDALADTQPTPLSNELVTRPGVVMGTPAFMSPEQHRGGPVDHRSDQFSFCVALWIALYRQPPFRGENAVQLTFSTVTGRIVPPPADHGRLADLEEILRRGLCPQPEQRFEEMEQLLEALERVGGSAGETSRPVLGHRYFLLETLPGEGLHRALDRLTGRRVNVECFKDAAPELREKRVGALQRLVALSHPNLVRILDYGFDQAGQAFVVRDPLEGGIDIVEAGRDLPPRLQASLMAQLLRALGYIHRQRLTHGRLTRAEVQVFDGRVKLLGLERASLSEGSEATPADDLAGAGHLAETMGLRIEAPKFVETLLSGKAPGAIEAIQELREAFGHEVSVETLETRESALRAAPFVGRASEVQWLSERLAKALSGRGGTVLIGGESGVGKSRLIQELHGLAVASGAVLVRGQADAERRYEYGVWRRVLTWLALLGEPDELTAGVLAAHVPDVERLVGKTVEPAPGLDAASMQARLARAAKACLTRIRPPLVILLEDLQWMRPESATLLSELAPELSNRPTLLVGTYRDDERSELPLEVPGADVLRLSRLDRDSVAAICSSLVGTRTSPSAQPASQQLAAELYRETEGNPFFVVEMLRALAEEAGGLQRVSTPDLPSALPTGGIRRVTGRRLARLEPWARPLIELAAVAGRELDLDLLRALAPDLEVDVWLQHCEAAAVIEPNVRGYRFTHDKIREHLLEVMTEEAKADLHARVAERLESLYPEREEVILALARHHRASRNEEAEARFVGRAGERSMAFGAHAEAVALLERALYLARHGPLERARWHRMLGEARYLVGDHPGAVLSLGKSVASVVAPLPTGGFRLGLRALWELAVQLLYLARRPLPPKDKVRGSAMEEASSAAGRLANLATYRGDSLRVITCSLASTNLADRAGWTNVYGLAVMGYSAAFLGAVRLAQSYFDRAREAALAQKNLQGLVEAIQMECVLLCGTGQFARAEELLDSGQRAAERAGFELGVALTRGFRASMDHLKGDIPASLRRYEAALRGAGKGQETLVNSLTTLMVETVLLSGDVSRATELIEASLPSTLNGDFPPLNAAFALAAEAKVRAARGEWARALQASFELDRRFRKGLAVPPIMAPLLFGSVSEAVVGALSEGDRSRPLKKLAARHRRRLVRFAKNYRTLACEAEWFSGELERLRGKNRRAEEHFQRGQAVAESLGRRVEAGRMEFGLGRVREEGSPEQWAHFERARSVFEDCGDRLHAERVAGVVRK